MSSKPNRWLLFQYGLLAFPLAFAGLPIYIHAPDFYTRHLGLSLGSLGAILLLVRLFDAIQDPVIGYLSDRYSTHRKYFLLSGVVALTLGLFALFFGPQLAISTATWFAGSLVLATTGFSVVVINLNMIGGFWSSDKDQRTRIAGWRESFALFGLLVASIVPSVLMDLTDATQAFRWLFVVYGFAMLIAWFFFTQFLKSVDLTHLNAQRGNEVKASPAGAFFQILHDKQSLFFFTYFLTQVAASLPAVLILFFVRDYLNAEAYTGWFLFLYFISGAALMMLWVALSKKIGKYHTWLLSMVLSIVVFIWVLLLQPGDIVSYSMICVLSGFALGADLSLPASIIADQVNAKKAEARATQYYGVMAFIPKLALALASGCAFLLLDKSGFVVAAGNTPEALQTLLILYGLVPCIVKLLSATCLWGLINTRGGKNEVIQNETIKKRSTDNGTDDIS